MRKFISIIVISLLMFSCEDEDSVNPDGFTENTVDISGSWKLDKVSQNGNDITAFVDIQGFELNLSYDIISNQPQFFNITNSGVPFATNLSSGSWEFDDVTYPTKISFKDDVRPTTVAKIAEFPIVLQTDVLMVEFQSDCSDNIYVYKLMKN
tara:strand:- start:724 stop:1179 length:456 start_codon:yes stop_codon:yes gene_type:complete